MKKLLIIIGLVLALVILLLVSLLFLVPKTPNVEEMSLIEEVSAIVEKNGLRFVVERIELVSEENEIYLAIYVNISNMGRSTWYIEPVKQFILVFEDGREVKAIGTSLWGGFYYVKPSETIDFYVVFPIADSVKPYKLVARSDEVIEVQLKKVLIYRPMVFQDNVKVFINPKIGDGIVIEYGRGFICRERKFFWSLWPTSSSSSTQSS